MNLFNLLCVDRSTSNTGVILSFVIIFLVVTSSILITLGVSNICSNIDNYKKDDESKKKLKRGLLYFLISIIIAALICLIINTNKESFADGCNGDTSPLLLVSLSFVNVFMFISPLVYFVKMIITIIVYKSYSKNEMTKKELNKKILTYIVIMLSLFLIFLILSCVIGIFKEPSHAESYATCWCS